ncbi:MAG TPA: hypothetical protein VGG17_06870 [Acidimicrobiales bacterium]|jgi:hypothetical protein
MKHATLRQSTPDFTQELARCAALLSDFEPTEEWTRQCDEWTRDVELKLWAWDPTRAERFMRMSLFESSGGAFMLDDMAGEHSSRDELYRRRRRLQSIVAPSWKRLVKLSDLLAP